MNQSFEKWLPIIFFLWLKIHSFFLLNTHLITKQPTSMDVLIDIYRFYIIFAYIITIKYMK